MSLKKLSLLLTLLVLSVLAMVACEGETVVKEVKVTEVVTQIVEKEGETVVETQVVQVEKEVVVTATPVPPTPEPEVPEEPQAGGTVNIWQPNGWPEQSWLHLSNWESVYAIGPMAQYLFRVNADYSLKPELATGYDVSDDGLVYTLHLREDVLWHDGEPFTAEDVVYTFQTYADPGKKPLGALRYGKTVKGLYDYQAGEVDEIEGIQAVDDHTVEFILESPDAGLPSLLWHHNFIPIVPKHIVETLDPEQMLDGTAEYWYTNPVGTGPYKFVQYVTDQYIEYERFDDYWGGTPGPEKLFMKIASPEVAIVMLEKGELDLINKLAPTEADRLQENPDVVVLNAPQSSKFYGLEANYDTMDGFWRNPKAKQAFLYAVNRQGYADAIFQGYARVANSFFDGTPYACPTMTEYSYDPEKAKELFDEIGMTEEVRAETQIDLMSWLGMKDRMDFLPIAQENLRQLGFKVNVDIIDNSLIIEYLHGDGPRGPDHDIWVLYMGPGADPGNITPYLDPESTSNLGLRGTPAYWEDFDHIEGAYYYDNPRVNELLVQGMEETDPEERIKIYQEIDCIWNEEIPTFTTVFANALGARSKRLQGVDWEAWAANGTLEMYYAGDWWIWQQ